MEKITFETYQNLTDGYSLNQLKKGEPSAINYLSYRKYKITIELIEEPKDVLIERLETMLLKTESYKQKDLIKSELTKLNP